MSEKARVIGLGQAAAGDDQVGLAVIERLRMQGAPEGVELLVAAEPSALLPLLETPVPVVLVDAVLAAPSGEVWVLEPAELELRGLSTMSTHGLGVAQAVALAQQLSPGAVSPSIHLVAVSISRPARFQQGLSPEVAAAVPRAAEHILRTLPLLEQEQRHA
ncbi:hydrogenase maturation protease [Hyalangium minutum]|uniref:Hydrogenase maturation protease n=1 Tax=Hyalangium minutum TaxID=394096 RepID=A0A085WHA1_9BACT|nr:hydrogenase maturation protease [Hyalangium minutum]KFE67064.1 Hydrogenase maturation protease [Hyalangium minutum]